MTTVETLATMTRKKGFVLKVPRPSVAELKKRGFTTSAYRPAKPGETVYSMYRKEQGQEPVVVKENGTTTPYWVLTPING